jgi:hypothetical protein
MVSWVGIWSHVFYGSASEAAREWWALRTSPPSMVVMDDHIGSFLTAAVGAASGCRLTFAHFIGCWILAVCITTPIHSWKSGVPSSVRVSRETGQALASWR